MTVGEPRLPSARAIPAGPADVSDAWLTAVLREAGALDRGRVTGHVTELVEAQGAAAVVARFILEYDARDEHAPRSVIAKFASEHEPMRALMNAMGGYAREVGFYRHFGSDAGISIPRCYHAAIDGATGLFALLLEDMEGAHRGDGVLPSIDDIELAVRALAPFHAKWWNHPRLGQVDFLHYPGSDADRAFMAQARAVLAASLPVARGRFGDRMPPTLVEVAELLLGRFDALVERRMSAFSEHVTLVHGDFHPGQMFFPSQGFGRFAVFDWQTVGAGNGCDDLARIISTGLPPDDQRACDMRLIKLYHGMLLDQGVRGYDLERCYDGFRLGLITTAIVDIIASVAIDPVLIEESAAREFDIFDAMFTWIASAVEAHDAAGVLLM